MQNLKAIKVAFDAHNCTSVEFCIAEEVVTPAAPVLMGMVPWCVTYRKIMKVQDNNILFSLPAYVDFKRYRPVDRPLSIPLGEVVPKAVQKAMSEVAAISQSDSVPESGITADPATWPEPRPAVKQNRYLRNLSESPGKSAPPVPAQPAEVT